ncbi:MAG: hypothetical protein LBG86_01240 [Puniceicoccales bacterium]|jgi:hypothetical protein|nr:hypothetical protein [Puniceicoccales bacterium]
MDSSALEANSTVGASNPTTNADAAENMVDTFSATSVFAEAMERGTIYPFAAWEGNDKPFQSLNVQPEGSSSVPTMENYQFYEEEKEEGKKSSSTDAVGGGDDGGINGGVQDTSKSSESNEEGGGEEGSSSFFNFFSNFGNADIAADKVDPANDTKNEKDAEIKAETGLDLSQDVQLNNPVETNENTLESLIQELSDKLEAFFDQYDNGFPENFSQEMVDVLQVLHSAYDEVSSALSHDDIGALERAIDSAEKAMELLDSHKEHVMDSFELDFLNDVREFIEMLKDTPEEEAKKLLMSLLGAVLSMLNIGDDPFLQDVAWKGGLAHAVLDPATPAYAKKKATRLLNMMDQFEKLRKEKELRQPKEGEASPAKKLRRKQGSDLRTSREKKSEFAEKSTNSKGSKERAEDSDPLLRRQKDIGQKKLPLKS